MDNPLSVGKLHDLPALNEALHLTKMLFACRGKNKKRNYKDVQLFRSMELDS